MDRPASLVDRDRAAVRWLLESNDPSVRYMVLVDILDVSKDSEEASSARARTDAEEVFEWAKHQDFMGPRRKVEVKAVRSLAKDIGRSRDDGQRKCHRRGHCQKLDLHGIVLNRLPAKASVSRPRAETA